MHPWFLAHTRINTDRHYAFQDAVRALHPQPLPSYIKFDWYGDEGIRRRTDDAYGSPLTYLEAHRFADIPQAVLDATSPWNRGCVLLLCTIAPQTPVVLWWH